MRPDQPELLTTLRDVAATAVTILDAFAQIRRERTAPPATPSAPPEADCDDPTDAPTTDGPAPQFDLDDAPDTSPNTAPSADPPDAAQPILLHPAMTPMETVHQRLMETARRTSAREHAYFHKWTTARDLADSIFDRLYAIAELASDAIEGDGLRTLPILDALIERLHDDYSDRSGPFAAGPEIELVR